MLCFCWAFLSEDKEKAHKVIPQALNGVFEWAENHQVSERAEKVATSNNLDEINIPHETGLLGQSKIVWSSELRVTGQKNTRKGLYMGYSFIPCDSVRHFSCIFCLVLSSHSQALTQCYGRCCMIQGFLWKECACVSRYCRSNFLLHVCVFRMKRIADLKLSGWILVLDDW